MTEKEKTVQKLANDAIYFDDSSDYLTALYQILATVNPELFNEDGELKEPLDFIE